MSKQTEDVRNPATSAPKPGDYSLGSLKSRAAARAVIEERKAHAVPDGLLTGIQIVEVSAEGRRLGEFIRIPPPGKEWTS